MKNETHKMNAQPGRARAVLVGLALAFTVFQTGCATLRPAPTKETLMQKQWGIEVTSLRLSANGHMLDFRYRVLDPAKAAALGDRRNKACLIDQATGIMMNVPNTPKIGPLRQTATQMEAGKVYFMMFANSGRLVKAGSRVTVAIGDFRAENLTVE